LPNSVIEDAVIGNGASIGPFARIRPDTNIGESAKIGNFVEVKKSTIGKGSVPKIKHSSAIKTRRVF
jgi:bifunctional UDP-N-acetylglucosamine pyrophosphorylase/glucosamine-1-phosphate N-acetyltransferase